MKGRRPCPLKCVNFEIGNNYYIKFTVWSFFHQFQDVGNSNSNFYQIQKFQNKVAFVKILEVVRHSRSKSFSFSSHGYHGTLVLAWNLLQPHRSGIKRLFNHFLQEGHLTSFFPSYCSHACTTSPLSVRIDTVVVVTTWPPAEVQVLVTVVTVTVVVELLLLEASISGAKILWKKFSI